MARKKTPSEQQLVRQALGARLREVRIEAYGQHGGSQLARELGVPTRSWYNYELGVTVPGTILLRFIELTSVEPTWLLHGRGNKFKAGPKQAVSDPGSPRSAHDAGGPDPSGIGASPALEEIFRSALPHPGQEINPKLLEQLLGLIEGGRLQISWRIEKDGR